ncbi:DUF3325 domain-containing protein [Reyranella sp.]|uniref:DUF3325 domain-containing protein n=1 Tax=Reyranella sp. TaxID=1929291 RepID=UPI003BA8824A
MPEAVLLAAVLAAVYGGFATLAMSQDRHWHALGGGRHCPRRARIVLRLAGYGLLFVALVLSLVRDGPAFGSLLWATAVGAGALAVVATLSWRARWLRPARSLVQHIG